MILLDSDVLIEILDKKSEKGIRLIKILTDRNEAVVTSSINFEEVLYGIFKRMNITELPEDHQLRKFPVLPFTADEASLAAHLEVSMENKGMKKPRGDVLIASVALSNNCRLMTLNRRHFKNIPGLELIDS
ncbi:MAG: type II toxin-antitoxin system VapC family toxin [Candidatus Hodarchaeales archaeon]